MYTEEIVFTKHALERLDLRMITREMVIEAVQNPVKQYEGENGTIKFIRKVNGANLHVITKPLPEENKWLIVSVWVRGENDDGTQSVYKRPYRQYEQRNNETRNRGRNTTTGIDTILLGIVIVLVVILIIYFAWNGGI